MSFDDRPSPQELGDHTCPRCHGTRQVQPDRYTAPEPCPVCVNEDEPEYGHEDDAAMWDELPAGPANPEIPIDPADFVSPLAGIRRYRDPLYTDSDEVF